MLEQDRLAQIRAAKAASHNKTYSENKLYTGSGWLARPIRTVLELVPLFETCKTLRILDLGAGVGRNCFPFLQRYKDKDCRVDCVDILPLAVQKLQENAVAFGVENRLRCFV